MIPVRNLLIVAAMAIGATSASSFDPGVDPGLYPVRVAPDHRHLTDAGGRPFLLVGDSPWSLITGVSKEEAERYLEDRRLKGFNTILVNLIEHKFHGPVNRAGQNPFLAPGDFSKPNPRYFEHADWVIRTAAAKGIQVLLAPLYLGYMGTDEGWIEEAKAGGAGRMKEWGRFVGLRYRDFDNIIWVLGGDRNPGAELDLVNAVAAGIRETDPRHIMTAHCGPEHFIADEYGSGGWLDLNATYTYGIVHSKLAEDYRRTPAKPFILLETTYEGEHNASAVQIRRQAYWAMLSGATGQVFGNRPLWLFDPGWEAALDSEGSRDMARLAGFFRSRPWQELVPDLEHKLVTSGLGEFNGLDYAAAAATPDRGLLIAYIPSQRAVTVALALLKRTELRARWFNPRDGSTLEAGRLAAEPSHEFTPPAAGDWVLVIEPAAASQVEHRP
jgi:hypothetical protein